MADVIFEEDNTSTVRHTAPASSRSSSLEKLMFKAGLAKTSQGAQQALLIIAIICIIAAIAFLFFGGVI